MAELAYTFHDEPWVLPLHLETSFSREFGSYDAANVFSPFDFSGASFQIVFGRERSNSGSPLLVLDTANGDITPGLDAGTIDFLFRPARMAALEDNQVYIVDINLIEDGVLKPFMRGKFATYGEPVA